MPFPFSRKRETTKYFFTSDIGNGLQVYCKTYSLSRFNQYSLYL